MFQKLSCNRVSIRFAVIICVSSTLVAESLAQPTNTQRQRRREFIEDLLNIVMEGGDAPKSNISVQPKEVSANMRRALTIFDDFSGNVYQLARLIQQDVNHTGGLRALLGDAVKINASARNLAERSRRFDSLQPLRDDFLELDREWQLFSRRVDSTYGLRNSIRTQLRKCDDLEKQLEQLFQVEKQIDRNALAGVATEIASHLRNLKEDIEIEIGDTRQGRAIMAGIRSVYDQNRRVAYSLRNRDPYETLLPEYEHLNELWTPVANSLRGLNDRHIQRHMLRIDEAERTIRKLMLLPEKFDVAAVLHQADQVHQSVETMLGKVTLRALTDLPSSHIDVIEAADNLRSTCTDFTDCARSGDDQSTLAELYHYLEDDWQRVNTCVGKSRREPVIAAVGQVQHSIDTLRDLLGVQLGIDRRDIVEKAAMLDQMAKNFDRQIRSYMSRPNRYPRQFQIDAMKASASFTQTANQLHAGATNGEDLKKLQQRGSAVIARWRALSPHLAKFVPVERMALSDLRSQLTPSLVEMQSLLTL